MSCEAEVITTVLGLAGCAGAWFAYQKHGKAQKKQGEVDAATRARLEQEAIRQSTIDIIGRRSRPIVAAEQARLEEIDREYQAKQAKGPERTAKDAESFLFGDDVRRKKPVDPDGDR